MVCKSHSTCMGLLAFIFATAIPCNSMATEVDVLITDGLVYTGDTTEGKVLDVGICGRKICGLFPTGQQKVSAAKIISAKGKVVSPGFIDPHTHTLAELKSSNKNSNINYLTQGVTTVVNGNDGDGPTDIAGITRSLEKSGIGTNVAFFVGHNSVRKQVMGTEDRHANGQEIKQMQAIVERAMKDGALGLSSGLYYVPGSYASTDEVVALAEVAGRYNGIYDTHLRDESTFNIGLLAAIDEAIYVAEQAGTPLHLAHIKALGVDVWGKSQQIIDKVNAAKQRGITITADQYPWLASGTKLHSAVMPKWVMADSQQAFFERLNDASLAQQLNAEIAENIRRRGGASSLLITAFKLPELVGKTLEQVAKIRGLSAVETAKALVQEGQVRVASFNMSAEDVERFMSQPWVVTSSDGTNGHPRKYASFPRKYQEYVVKKQLLSMGEFIQRSSANTASILGMSDRGVIRVGAYADILVFDKEKFKPNADFSHWNKLSEGVETVLVNGTVVIEQSKYNQKLAGKFVSRS